MGVVLNRFGVRIHLGDQALERARGGIEGAEVDRDMGSRKWNLFSKSLNGLVEAVCRQFGHQVLPSDNKCVP